MKRTIPAPLHRLLPVSASLLFLAACTGQAPEPPAPTPPERLFLQQVTDNSAVIKWRGDARQLCLVESPGNNKCFLGELTGGYHREVLITGLEPETEYRYRLDNHAGTDYRFRTAPPKGELPESGSINLWILGDSGTAGPEDTDKMHGGRAEARAVMAGYETFTGLFPQKSADLILMLGDNAYLEGTDREWQRAVFDLYLPMIYQAAIWPTIGNHEMGAQTAQYQGRTVTYPGISSSPDPDSYITLDDRTPRRMPYLDIFSLPTRGEAGGVPSGTEQYYSFDYGTLHVVSLDSQLSARDPAERAAMKRWLESDLQSNTQSWTVVIFHHPPYSKSSHDSDSGAVARLGGIDVPMVDLRREFTGVFENYGVDMVYSGHSHAYERSWYLHGHRGDADSFDAGRHAEVDRQGNPVSGRPGEPYFQVSPSSGQDDRVVYTVAGSAGMVDTGDGNLDHPAHAVQPEDPENRHGLAQLGSVHLEVTESSLHARFIDTEGRVLDQVVIRK